jgi:hypothetical protein
MATPPKKKSTGGRVTPKGTRPDERRERRDDEGHEPHGPGVSRRYTPPVPQSEKVSPPWVAPTMFALLGVGALTIIVNYLDVLPGGTNNWYLFLGLGLILGGIITATKLH